MALDLGELDILRDAATGRIFIVDVNRMPFGPPKPIAVRTGIHAVTLYADAFSRLAGRWLESETKIVNREDLTPPPLPPPSPAG
jgi:hypothetical protein